MADIKYEVAIDDRASAALGRIQSNVAKTTQAFAGFRTAVAAIGFGALTKSAVAYADSIKDISDATDIAIENVLGFGKAVQAAGGNTERAQQALVRFNLSVAEAAEGSLKMQNAFRDIGISLDDLATLSEQALFDKVIAGISSIEDVTERARLSNELFGKSLRGVNLQGLSEGYQRATASAGRYAADVRRAAELQDRLDAAFSKIKLSVLSATAPLADFINGLDEEKINSFIDATVKIGGAAVAIAALAKTLDVLVKSLGYLAAAATTAWAVFGRGAALVRTGIAAIGAALPAIVTGFRAVATVLAGAGTLAAGWGAALAAATAGVPVALGAIALGLGKIAVVAAAVAAGAWAVNEAFKATFGNGIIDTFAAKLENLVTSNFPRVAAALNSLGQRLGMAPSPAQTSAGNATGGSAAFYEDEAKAALAVSERNKEITDALARQRREIAQISEDFRRNLDIRAAQLQLETEIIGLSERDRDLRQALADLAQKEAQEIERLQQAKAALTKDNAALAADYDRQIAAVRSLTAAEQQRITSLIDGLNKARQAEEFRIFQVRTLQDFQDRLIQLQRQSADVGLKDIERGYRDIARAAEDMARAAIRAEESRRGAPLSAAEELAYYAKAREGVLALTEAQQRLNEAVARQNALEEFRQFNLKTQTDQSDRLLQLQRDIADIGLTDIEKKYRDITRAADDSARAAIRAEEERRRATGSAPLSQEEITAYYRAAQAGTEELLKAQRKLYESSRTFSAGWTKSFKDYVDNARDAAKQAERLFEKFTQGLEDALVDFAKTGRFEWRKFVGGLAEELLRSQIRQTLASVMTIQNPMGGGGSIGDMFGGLFGSLLGSGGSQRGQSASQPLFVVDVAARGGGILSGSTGGIVPTQGGGILGTIGSAISGVVGTIGKTLGSVVGGIGSVVGGIGSAIGGIFGGGASSSASSGSFLNTLAKGVGSLFGGFFATGGTLPAGKFGIVGERGPELISGPATITPMAATQVTYNIQAVDALSFQALVARDPGFIHAVAMAGAKSVPQRR